MTGLQQAARSRALRTMKPALRWMAAHWPWPVRARLREGPTMAVDLRSAIGRGILVTGVFDPAVFVPIREALVSGGNFVDVGANVGYYSVLAAHALAGRGRVFAFEIDPRSLRCLRMNAQAAGVDRIVVEEVAIGAEPGRGRLVPGRDPGHTRVTAEGVDARVPMTSIDEWRRASGVGDIRAIKIDIEGGELAALEGAAETLRDERPTIVLEVLEHAKALGGGSRAEVEALLERSGYVVAEVVGANSPTIVARPAGSPLRKDARRGASGSSRWT